MYKILKLIHRSLFIIALFSPGSAWATAYFYVYPGLSTGSNDGSDWTSAWKSFADINWSTLSTEAESQPVYLYVKKGSISTAGLAIGGSGSSDANRIFITTKSDDTGAKPIIQNASSPIDVGGYDYLTIQNIEITGMSSSGGNGAGVYMTANADYVTVDSCDIHDIRLYGIKVVDEGTSTHVTVSNCHIYNIYPSVGNFAYKGISIGARYYNIYRNVLHDLCGDAIGDSWGVNSIIDGNEIYAVGVNDNSGSTACADSHPDDLEQYGSDGNTIRNNYFHDSPSGGIQLEDAKNMTLYNNVFANIAAGNGPVDAYHGAGTGATGYFYVYNNTFYGNTNQCINFYSNVNYSEIILKNNIMFSNGGGVGIPANMTSVTVMDYNDLDTSNNWGGTAYNSLATWQTASGQDAHSVWGVDPKFVSASNYRLTANSPESIIGAGADLSTIFATDKDGNTRIVPWDLGAYEYMGNAAVGAGAGVSIGSGAGLSLQ